MKKSTLKVITASFIGCFIFGSLVGLRSSGQREYKPGEYVPEEDAYFVEKIEDPTGLVKATKFVTPTDDQYNSQKTRSLGTNLIGDIESVWSSYTGKGTTVAIIDDGFDHDHPEYTREDGTSAILSTSRYYYASGNNAYFKEFSSDPSCIEEDWESDGQGGYEWASHGTNTSTTAAAPMNNGGGVGIAPDADILALKIDFSFVAIKAAIQYAINQHVDVINMSLGAYAESFTDGWGDSQSGSSSTSTYLNSVCQNAYDAGIIVVAAAGNESTWHKSYPACNTKVIGVGAIGDWDNKGNANELAEFTNYVGSSQTGEINVDILAPGYVYTATQGGTSSSSHTHIYSDTQGTSFSCPIVAGAACLWKEKYPDGTPDEFLSQLQSSADGIGYYKNKMIPVSGWYESLSDVGPSNITNGRLNVATLLDISSPYVDTKQSSLSLSVGEKKQIELASSNGTITYSSGDTSIATVSDSGLVTGTGAGSTNITVTASKNGETATATVGVTVAESIAATSLTFVPDAVTLTMGETYDSASTIALTPSNASRIFLFESENEAIATVNIDTGLITAIGAGTTNINAIAGYGDGDDTLVVTVEAPATPSSFSQTYTYSNQGSTWTLSNCTDQNNYWLCPASGTTSVALFPDVFEGKNVASNVTITINSATYGSGTNPSASTYKIYNSEACSTQVTASQSGTLPSSSSYTDVIYTVAQSEASAIFNDDLAILITKPGKQIRIKSVTISFSYTLAAPKIINSLSATYSGSSIYVGGSLDNSKVSVTATYTDPSKYNAEVLPSSDYSLSDFSSATAGDKTITVTYTGSLSTTSSPLTTTFTVNVKADTVTNVVVSNTKTYHPGETIVKSDITVTLQYESGKSVTTTDFSFANDGYQFTYNDAPSGGATGNKQFSITYNSSTYNFTAKVSRIAYEQSEGLSDTLTRATTGVTSGSTNYTSWSNKKGASGAIYAGCSAGSNDSIQLRSKNSDSGIVTTTSGGNIAKVTVSWNSNTQTGRVINVYGKNSAYSSAANLYNSTNQGTLLGTIECGESTELEITGNYAYVGIRSADSALYLDSVTFTYGGGTETPANVANYIMYEDTNNQCVTKLDLAIEKLNKMSNEDKATFWSSNDYVISTARTRLLAWAANQGKTINYSNNTYTLSNASNSLSVVSLHPNQIIVVITVVAFISISSFAAYLFLRKKKENLL